MTEVEQASGEIEAQAPVTPQVNPSEVVSKEDFRKFQSAKDREVAEAKKQAEALQQRLAQVEEQFEQLIQDPVAKAQYQNERVKAKLAYYEQMEALNEQRNYFVNNFGIPYEVVSGATSPGEVTKLALQWQQQQLQNSQTRTEPKPQPQPKVEEEDAPVSLAAGTPPDAGKLNEAGIEKRIADLRKIAQSGKGAAADRARVEILQLEAQRNRGRVQRARV